jgi:hypothetical protein
MVRVLLQTYGRTELAQDDAKQTGFKVAPETKPACFRAPHRERA